MKVPGRFLLPVFLFFALLTGTTAQQKNGPGTPVPQLIAPNAESETTQPIPTFRWKETDRWSISNPFEYHIQISRDPGFNQIVDQDRLAGSITWYVPTNRLSEGTYHWRVAVVGPRGNRTPWSPSRSVRINRPETFRVEKKSSFKQIQTVIKKAAKHSPARVRFEPGTYQLRSKDAKAFIDLEKESGLRINGNGSRIVLNSPTPMVQLTGCKDIFISGFTFTYEPPMYTAGRVHQVNRDQGSFNAKMLSDHPLPDEVNAFSDVHNAYLIDPSEQYTVKKNTPLVLPPKRFRKQKNRIYRFQLERENQIQFIDSGDIYALVPRRGKGGKRFDASGCSDIVWYNMTIHGAPNECLSSFYTQRLAILNVRIKRRSDRVITTNNGGNNHHNARTGPWIENCLFENSGDDLCHVNGYVMGIREQPAPDRLRFSLHQPYDQYDRQAKLDFRTGDRLQFYNREEGKRKGRRIVNGIQLLENSVEVKLNRPIQSITPGRLRPGRGTNRGITRVFNLSRGCNEFVFRNNTARFGRRIGVLAKGEGGLIENNMFRQLGGGGVELWNSPFEGFGATNYIIRKNTFQDNTRLKRNDASIWVTGFPPGGDTIHRNLLISRNRIRESPFPAINISETDSVRLWKNRIGLSSENGSAENAIILENNRNSSKIENVIK